MIKYFSQGEGHFLRRVILFSFLKMLGGGYLYLREIGPLWLSHLTGRP